MRRTFLIVLVACAAAAGTALTGSTLAGVAQTPVETPLTPSACNPRPRVVVRPLASGPGQLRVTVVATNNASFPNLLRSIAWTAMANATVQVNGIGVVAGQTTPFPGGAGSVDFLVTRVTAGQSATVNLTITDDCGAWPTLVGGGPSAF